MRANRAFARKRKEASSATNAEDELELIMWRSMIPIGAKQYALQEERKLHQIEERLIHRVYQIEERLTHRVYQIEEKLIH